MGYELDDLDERILSLLGEDARHRTAADIAGEVAVTANTVRNRIRRLEEEGVIAGYMPIVDYERTGNSLHVLVQCTVSIHEREAFAAKALSVDGVVAVREVMTGHRNLHVEIVADERDEITAAVSRLNRQGLVIEDEELLKSVRYRPYDRPETHDPDSERDIADPERDVADG